ncbi:MAG: tryptophan synthase subunit alpha [bacterium]
MKNLASITNDIRSAGKKSLVPFFTAGYPDERTFLQLLDGAAEAGCRLLEVGVPFSDPIADGPVIQVSSQQALAGGMTLTRTLDLCAEAGDRTGAALVLMGYLNPILALGLTTFAARARQAGVAGVIIPDVPLEESTEIRTVLTGEGITFVDLVAPTSGPQRCARIAEVARGFLYLISVAGVTGSRVEFDQAVARFGDEVKRYCRLPLYVGFGVSDRQQAVAICRWADGAIIGSELIRIIQAAAGSEWAVAAVREFLVDINLAINPAGNSFSIEGEEKS